MLTIPVSNGSEEEIRRAAQENTSSNDSIIFEVVSIERYDKKKKKRWKNEN